MGTYTNIVAGSTVGSTAAGIINNLGADVEMTFRKVSGSSAIISEVKNYQEGTVVFSLGDGLYYKYTSGSWNSYTGIPTNATVTPVSHISMTGSSVHGLGTMSVQNANNVAITGGTAALSYVQFDTSYADGNIEGRMHWDADDKTMVIGMSGGSVNLQVGEESLIRVKNSSSCAIDNGKAVYITGGLGSNPTIALANNSGSQYSLVAGIATENIAVNGFGYVTAFGVVRDVDTSDFAAGNSLWLGTDGGLINTKPVAPLCSSFVGTVLVANKNTGMIFASPFRVPKLGFLSDVYAPDLIADKSSLEFSTSGSRWQVVSGSSTSYVKRSGDTVSGSIVIQTVSGSSLVVGGSSNNATFDSNGFMTLAGSAMAWDDLQVDTATVKLPAVNSPTWREWAFGIGGGVTYPILGFDLNNYIDYRAQTSHSMKLNTYLHQHCHYSTPTNAAGKKIKFQLDVVVAGVDEAFSVPAGSPYTYEFSLSGSESGKHKLFEIGEIPGNTTVSTIYQCKLTRIPASSNDYAGEVYLMFNDGHYQKDEIGSDTEYAK